MRADAIKYTATVAFLAFRVAATGNPIWAALWLVSLGLWWR